MTNVQKPIKTMNIVALYEDFVTGKEARKACDLIKNFLGRNCEVIYNLWRFDVLEIPAIQQLMASRTVKTDIVIICAYQKHRFSSFVDHWIKRKLSNETLFILINVKQSNQTFRENTQNIFWDRFGLSSFPQDQLNQNHTSFNRCEAVELCE